MRLDQINLSQFFARDAHPGRTQIPHKVTIVLDTETFECSGIVLAHHSATLRDMMMVSSEIYMDMFAGQKSVLEDCIDVLHGADVTVDMDNIQGLLKFSNNFKVDMMFDICMTWVNDNMTTDKLCDFLRIGLYFLETGDGEVLDACTGYLAKELRTGLFATDQITRALKLSKSVQADAKTIYFLLNKDLMSAEWSVLPVITDWIASEEAATLVLVRIDELDLYESVCEAEESAMEFVEKLHQFTLAFNPLKILNKLQHGLLIVKRVKRIKLSQADKTTEVLQNMSSLINNGDAEPLMKLAGGIETFVYAEIVVAWIRQHGTTAGAKVRTVKKLWSSIVKEELGFYYVWDLWDTIMSVSNNRHKLPHPVIENLDKANYKLAAHEFKYQGPGASSVNFLPKLLGPKHALVLTGPCTFTGCDQGGKHVWTLQLRDKVPCYDLERFDNALPYDTHHHKDLAKHWYLSSFRGANRVILSLVTNTYQEVLDQLALLTVEDKPGVHYLGVRQQCTTEIIHI